MIPTWNGSAISKAKLRDRLKADIGFAARFYKALALFLADRMRNTIRRMGYGNLQDEPARDDMDLDELDVEVLDNVHLAGARFERGACRGGRRESPQADPYHRRRGPPAEAGHADQ